MPKHMYTQTHIRRAVHRYLWLNHNRLVIRLQYYKASRSSSPVQAFDSRQKPRVLPTLVLIELRYSAATQVIACLPLYPRLDAVHGLSSFCLRVDANASGPNLINRPLTDNDRRQVSHW